jgi:DNA-binding CsgD family transcriptional regulator
MTKRADRNHPEPAGFAPHLAHQDIVSAVEAERLRLAKQLQDNAIGPLTLLLSQTATYQRTLSGDPNARMALSVLASLAQQVLQRLRDLEASLNPEILNTLGLEPALKVLGGQAARAHGIEVQLLVERLSERLPSQVELALYRAAQDLLERAVGRAHASQLLIRLEQHDKAVLFAIGDNGALSHAQASQDAMLALTTERLKALGARVELGTGPLGGLQYTVRMDPLPTVRLTRREREVLTLVVEGLSNKEMAQALGISTRTVNFHLENLYGKLGVGSRTEAAVYALRQGWQP